MSIQNDKVHRVRISWYREYRKQLWHKLIVKEITIEQHEWLNENIGQRHKMWEFDNEFDIDFYDVMMEMIKDFSSFPPGSFPSRIFFKHEEDKVKFILRWL